jgi:cytidine deaminase
MTGCGFDRQALHDSATQVCAAAYAPYSRSEVGSAVVDSAAVITRSLFLNPD